MIRQVFAAEINFEDAPLAVREEFSGTEGNIRRILTAVRSRVDEVYAVGNDQRFTLYAVHDTITPLKDFFHREYKLKGYVQYYYNTEESVTHLFASASGLLSQIKGEPQVLQEISNSYAWAAANGYLGVILDQVLRKAINVGRAVRTATGIDKFCSSVVETGMQLLYNKLNDMHDRSFLIVGTGKIARMALQYLYQEGMPHIIVTGYQNDRVTALAKQFGVTWLPLDEAGALFLQSDVIIGASHQALNVDNFFDQSEIPGSEQGEKSRYMLDFGIPRNFTPRLAELLHAELYNVDDLRRMQDSPLESFGGVELAWSMVMKASNRFAAAIDLLHYSPVLAAYLARMYKIEKGEVQSAAKRGFLNLLMLKTFASSPATFVKDYKTSKTLLNNYRPENPEEIVKHIQTLKKFTYYLQEN